MDQAKNLVFLLHVITEDSLATQWQTGVFQCLCQDVKMEEVFSPFISCLFKSNVSFSVEIRELDELKTSLNTAKSQK